MAGARCCVGYALDLGEGGDQAFSADDAGPDLSSRCHVGPRPRDGYHDIAVGAGFYYTAPEGPGWHDLPAESVSGEVNLTSFRLYPGAVMVPHDQLIGSWPKKA